MRARNSWRILYEQGVEYVWIKSADRCGKSIGDSRNVPFFKDILKAGMNIAENEDIILWCNDDVILDPMVIGWCMNDVAANDAMSMRRIEPECLNCVHIGRELFAFRKEWLLSKWEDIPDFLQGSPYFDIIIAAMIRLEKGVKSTIDNMKIDYPLCDAIERYAIHEAHESGWAGLNEYVLAGNIHNKRLAKEWAQKYCRTLVL